MERPAATHRSLRRWSRIPHPGPAPGSSGRGTSWSAYSQTEPDGETQVWVRDPETGLTQARLQTDGAAASATYSASGDPLTVVNEVGEVTTYTYGPSGEVLTETAPDGGVTRHAYDAHLNRVRTETPKGEVSEWTYDLLSRVM